MIIMGNIGDGCRELRESETKLESSTRMAIRLTWYGHACFLIRTGDAGLLIDPFITGNPTAPVKAQEVRADFILVSHGHGDHLGDTVDIARRTGAAVISNFEIHNWLIGQGLEKVHPQHIGGGSITRGGG
jgi:L-ascorbate metabolism protein UlaG (beta-lactamase superfamily)